MRSLLAVWKRETRSYFNSPIAYYFAFVFVMVTGILFFVTGPLIPDFGRARTHFFIDNQASLAKYFDAFPGVLAMLVPALCMRLWPEERKSGTIEVLMTMPVRPWEVVMGKFLAAMMVVVATYVATLIVPITVAILAVEDLDLGPIWGGYLGALLLAGAFCAIGSFTSAMFRDQVNALLGAQIVCVALAGISVFNTYLGGSLFAKVTDFISFSSRFSNIERGVLDFRDVLYFVSFAALFLYLNSALVGLRRQR